MMTMADLEEELRYLDSREGELDTTCVSTIEHMRELLERAKAFESIAAVALGNFGAPEIGLTAYRVVRDFNSSAAKGFKP